MAILEVSLQDALNNLYDPSSLLGSPLMAWLGLSACPDSASALQAELCTVVEDMRARTGPPATPASRHYWVLRYRYVEQLAQHTVAQRLGVTPRHLRRIQRAAVHALLLRLVVRHGSLTSTGAPGAGEAFRDQSIEIDREMSWLADSMADRTTEVEPTICEAMRLAEALAARHDVTLEQCVAHPLPRVMVSQTVLKQIVLNLMTAAMRTAPGGSIRVSAEATPGTVAIRVSAMLPSGIAERDLVWERSAINSAGRLSSLFDAQLALSGGPGWMAAELNLPLADEMTVLAVEDNADTLQLWQRYVQGTRFRLVGVSEASQALTTAARLRPSAIVLDVMLPGTDGWELLGQLRHHPDTASIPVIVCTVLPQDELAMALGASGFVRKPTTGREFRAALERACVTFVPDAAMG